MIRTFLLSLPIILFFPSCSSVYADKLGKKEGVPAVKRERVSSPDENFLLLLSLDLELRGDVINSTEGFKRLFEETRDRDYSLEYIRLLNFTGRYEKLISEFVRLEIERDDDHLRELATAYIGNQELERAVETLQQLQNIGEMDYRVLAEINFQLQNYDNALSFIKEAYRLSGSPELAISISKILYIYLNREDEAISTILSHHKIHGYNRETALHLAQIYTETERYREAIELFREAYRESGDVQIAKRVIKLYSYLSDTTGIMEFLEESGFNNELLLRIYMSQKMVEKGYKLSKKLYEENNEPYLLAQNAVFEYELFVAGKKSGKTEKLKSVVSKLEKVVSQLNDASFYNYLGYLMIDHNYRVSDGVDYVKLALEIEPESYYIIDSLAWGQYKLGKCRDALKNMRVVIDNLGSEDGEIKEHWEKINRCQKK
jgi:tetratricopeptide (TPR) repeat protein